MCSGNRAVARSKRDSDRAAAGPRRRPGLEPRRESRQSSTVQSDFVAAAPFGTIVAQLENDRFDGHDVEFVAPWGTAPDHFPAATGQGPVRPPAQARQTIKAGFTTAVAHDSMPPPVTAGCRVVAQDGGGVAEIVGRLLRELGGERQVLCVTHLPQVAAQADWQWQVSKATRNGVTLSAIQPLDEEGRVQEIARMLGGVEITDITRQHASELLRKPA